MKFWHASAIVPLLMSEATTKSVQAQAAGDPVMLVWWASEVERASAIARLERDGAFAASAANQEFDRLRRLAQTWHEVDRAIRSVKRPYDSCAFIRSVPPTLCNSPPPSSPPNGGRRHWSWSPSTTGWPLQHEKRDSWSSKSRQTE